MIDSISVNELKKLSSINLIDIRSIEKYNSNHILNALNVPVNELLLNPDRYLNKREKYYIYCQKGIQSVRVCQILKIKSFSVVNVIGGYEAWILNE